MAMGKASIAHAHPEAPTQELKYGDELMSEGQLAESDGGDLRQGRRIVTRVPCLPYHTEASCGPSAGFFLPPKN